jgi:enoyl-CoA hydratase/carnithine racemase
MSAVLSDAPIRTARSGAVFTLTMARAPVNALDETLVEAMECAVDAACADSDVSVIHLRSANRVFCAGADLALMAQSIATPAGLERMLALVGRLQRLAARLEAAPAVTLAEIGGAALGGGFELALACDVIVADGTAVVGLPEVSVGVIPGGGGTQLLPRRVGAARAAELIFTARRVEAEEAHRLGLVDQLVAAGEDRAEALALAARIAANSPVGLRAAKKALRLGHGLDLRAGLEVEDAAWRSVAFSGDRAEGVAAFNEKRRPQWPGE